MDDVTMVMVIVARTVTDEDERERKKRTVAAQGVVHKGMMMGTRVHGTAGRTRHIAAKRGLVKGFERSKKNKFKVILQRPDGKSSV
jgi:hypothetical protein